MASILRVKLRWEGFIGGPGYTVLHFRDFGLGDGAGAEPDAAMAQSAADRVHAFASAIPGVLPDDVRLTVENDVEMLDEFSGQLEDVFAVTPGPEVVGASALGYAAPVGAVINWRTAGVRNGRRIRGRSFLVPLASGTFTTSGQLGANSVSSIQTAADALVDSSGTPDLGVWARPSAVGALDGNWVVATSATVPTAPAVLRSRRD